MLEAVEGLGTLWALRINGTVKTETGWRGIPPMARTPLSNGYICQSPAGRSTPGTLRRHPNEDPSVVRPTLLYIWDLRQTLYFHGQTESQRPNYVKRCLTHYTRTRNELASG